MEIIHGHENQPRESRPSVVTVGVFDGVHRGHRAIMQTVRSIAGKRSARPTAVTFDRIPEEVLHPETAPSHITTLDQKLELIAAQGIELTLVLKLGRRVLSMPAEKFITDVLRGRLSAIEVVVGRNFAFGKGRRGTVEMLEQTGGDLGFGVTIVPPVVVEGTVVSSTEVRRLISTGNVEKASLMLGRLFVLRGKVVPGDALGRKLGFPTANILASLRQILPAPGVYSACLEVEGRMRAAAVNVGTRPTIGGRHVSVEVYILGFSGDIYGRQLDIAFDRRLRDQIRFADTDALATQIRKDVEQVAALADSLCERHLT